MPKGKVNVSSKVSTLTAVAGIAFAGAVMAGFIVSTTGSDTTAGYQIGIKPPITLPAHTLIRGSLPAVYYLGTDGKRYVFPNEKTYKTWFPGTPAFNNVVVVDDAIITNLPIGGNVTYQPGVRMVKINSDPKVYAVSFGGKLRHITSETIAKSLYGADWATKVDDVPDAFFVNYILGPAITSAAQYSPANQEASVGNISQDKQLPMLWDHISFFNVPGYGTPVMGTYPPGYTTPSTPGYTTPGYQQAASTAIFTCQGSCSGRVRSSADTIAKITFNGGVPSQIKLKMTGDFNANAPVDNLFKIQDSNGVIRGMGPFIGDSTTGSVVIPISAGSGNTFTIITNTFVQMAADTPATQALILSLLGSPTTLNLKY
jgi:hypothetical protein